MPALARPSGYALQYEHSRGGPAPPIGTMAILNSAGTLAQVGTESVISVAQQMAFYLSVDEAEIRFDSSDDDSCTIEVNGQWLDVAFDPITSMVIDWFPAE